MRPQAAEEMTAPEPQALKQALRRAERRRKLRAAALVAPLLLYLLIVLLVPIAFVLYRAVDNPEVASVLPRTTAALAEWSGQGLPQEATFAALAADLAEGRSNRTLAAPAQRLNMEISGFRSLLLTTARRLERAQAQPASWQRTFLELDPRWGEGATWAAVRRAGARYTPFYLLSALDLRQSDAGEIVAAPKGEAIFLDLYRRTLWISLVVMVLAVLLGYPLAYLMANLPSGLGNAVMILVLLPFWTSLLVRTSAWVVLLQREGLVNGLLQWLGLTDAPLQLIFNRFGVYVAMLHILLPFLVLPLYSVMKGIQPTQMRAALSLGATPAYAFLRVYLPQSLPGVGAGCLLVFILAIGYYITPALVGGPQDQMISYYIAFFTNQTINWGLAAALSIMLLVAVVLLYALYSRLVGVERLRLG